MNVLFILTDQHSREFTGCYGGPTRTPNLDGLARRGMRFTSAYCMSPICGPSRAGLFSGRYVHDVGAWDNTSGYDGRAGNWPSFFDAQNIKFASIGRLDLKRGICLGASDVRLAKYHSGGDVVALYRTQPAVERRAFYYEYFDIQARQSGTALEEEDEKVTAEAIRWLRTERPRDRPWVCYVGYSSPHPKWHPEANRFEHHLRNRQPLRAKYLQPIEALHPADQRNSITTCAYRNLGEDDIARMHAAYHALVEEVDDEVGKLLNVLASEGLMESTLVIYSCDHGESARAHGNLGKNSMYEESVGVPLIIAGPGVEEGAVEDTPVSHHDLFPTIADAVGLKQMEGFEGYPLQPLLRKEGAGFGRTFVFSEYHANHAPNAMYMIRESGWKYIEHLDEAPSLYNLREDPDEMNDLMREGRNQVPHVVASLRDMLNQVCDIRKVDHQAKADQRRTHAQMLADGILEEAIYLRGYDRRTDRLVPWDWQVFEDLYHPREQTV